MNGPYDNDTGYEDYVYDAYGDPIPWDKDEMYDAYEDSLYADYTYADEIEGDYDGY